MPGYSLRFRLDPLPGSRPATPATQAADLELRRAVYARMGLDLQSSIAEFLEDWLTGVAPSDAPA